MFMLWQLLNTENLITYLNKKVIALKSSLVDERKIMNKSEEIQSYCSYRQQLPLSTLRPKLVGPFLAIFIVLTFTSTSMNSFVFTFLFRNKKMRNKRHVQLLLCLSVSDLLVGILVSPASIAQVIIGDGPAQCLINRLAGSAHILMSTRCLIITTISLDRYLLIARNASYHVIMTSKRFSIALALPWILSFVLLILAILKRKYFVWCQLVLATGTCICFVVSYWKIQLHLTQHELYWELQNQNNPIAVNRRQNKRSTKIMAAIIIVTLLCSVMIFLTLIVNLLDYYHIFGLQWIKTWRRFYLGIIGNVLLQSNSTLNPILYICISKEFQKFFSESFRNCRTRKRITKNDFDVKEIHTPVALISYSTVTRLNANEGSMNGIIHEKLQLKTKITSTTSRMSYTEAVEVSINNLRICFNSNSDIGVKSTLETKL